MSRPGLALRLFGCLALFSSASIYAQHADRLTSTEGVRAGQTLLCRYELVVGGDLADQEYAFSCRESLATDHEVGLHCFLDAPVANVRLPAFACPVTAPLPFIAGGGLRLGCEPTPEQLRGQIRRSLAAQGRPLSTPIPTLKCAVEKFDITWEEVYGKD